MPEPRRAMPRAARPTRTSGGAQTTSALCEAPLESAARLRAAGRMAEASVVLSGALSGGPEDAPLLHEMARLRLRQRDPRGAAALLESAVQIAPADSALHFALATTYAGAGRPELAEEACARAVRCDPAASRAHNLLGWLTLQRGDAPAALAHFQEALRHDPQSVDAQVNASVALNRSGEYAAARALCEAMSRQWPGHAGVWINLGVACKGQRDLAAARAAFQRASASPAARVGLGHVALLQGDLAAGLSLLEARRDISAFGAGLTGPAWQRGERIPRRLLVLPEQSMSDTILMSRFLPLIAARCDRVTVVVEPPLERLFASAFPGVTVRTGAGGADCDAWAPVMSLPYLLGLERIEQIPTSPWIDARATATRRDGGLPRIGLNWAGNPAHADAAVRSAPLDALALLLREPGVEWVSLHRGAREMEALRYRLPEPLARARDFQDTAEVIAGLDMVISTETAVPNLSAAMGVPTVILSGTDPDWRWHGWYDDVTVCAQDRPGEWQPVVQRTLQVLRERLLLMRGARTPERRSA